MLLFSEDEINKKREKKKKKKQSGKRKKTNNFMPWRESGAGGGEITGRDAGDI